MVKFHFKAYALLSHSDKCRELCVCFLVCFGSKNVVAELFLAIIMSGENILFCNICDLVRSVRWRKILCEFFCKIEISVRENISWNICVKVKTWWMKIFFGIFA